jgi:hypothetical protein
MFRNHLSRLWALRNPLMEAKGTEFVAAELKKLCGWGLQPMKLPLHPGLRNLVNAPSDAKVAQTGLVIRRALIEAIDSLSGTYEFCGNQISAEKIRRAYRLLLMIEGTGLNVVERRSRAIMLLGVYCTVDTWRRPYGLEFSFMLILAEVMVSRAEVGRAA